MSNFTGHRNAGLVIGAVIGTALFTIGASFGISQREIIASVASAFIFSLFPDIDIKSTPSKIFYWVVAAALGYFYYSKNYMIGHTLGMFAILPQLVRHRGIFHHPITAILLPLWIFYLYYVKVIDIQFAVIVYAASVIGYFTHLFMDRKR